MSDCTAVRPLLPEAVYESLSAEQAAEVRRHLAQCPACQAEFAALGEVRDALNAVPPVTSVRVDLAGLYRAAARRQAQMLRRWRRVAGAVAAVAALLLVVMFLRLELRVEAQQLVVRWGVPSEATVLRNEPRVKQPPVVVPPVAAAAPEITVDDWRLVKRLIHALAAQQEMRDQSQTQELLALRQRLDQWQTQSEDRWETIERYISALQTTQTQWTRKE